MSSKMYELMESILKTAGVQLDEEDDFEYIDENELESDDEQLNESEDDGSLEYAEKQVDAWDRAIFFAEHDDTYGANRQIEQARDNLRYWKKEAQKRQQEEPLQEDEEVLDETKPARYLKHMDKNKSFANVSAERHNPAYEPDKNDDEETATRKRVLKQKQQEENNKKTEQLKKDIKDLGLSYIKTYGVWKENGSDPATEENSFLIPNITKEQAMELGKKYGQYSVIFKGKNDDTGYMYVTLDNDDFGNVDLKFDMSNDSKFSQVQKKQDELDPYSGWTGLKKNGKGYNFEYIKKQDK